MATKFRTKLSTGNKPESPEALFRDLRGRSSEIRHLWSHQADVLRAYTASHMKSSDVALQLPTGSGKTLVGLLIGEYRRLAQDERVVYLCPTRQLAYQVGAQAQRYGIKAHVLVGPQADYDPGHYADYVTAKAMAVTTYNGVFNSRPKLNDAQVLILDDAHAAENYVVDLWTVSIDRKNTIYRELLDILGGTIPDATIVRCIDDECDPNTAKWVEKVPIPLAYPLLRRIAELLDANTADIGNAKYPWYLIRDHLPGCCIYVSWAEISIRPVFPPTKTHAPFAQAHQRIFMSATLGEGGDLERTLGVTKITRVPTPAGWDKQAIGRRLMLFPDRSLSEEKALSTALQAVGKQGRSLVMCPDRFSQRRFAEALQKAAPKHSIMSAESIEASLQPFIDSKNACLILTNRYDGIDLPDEACRLAIVFGHPNATNLQEKFLWARLNATAVLTERVRTRLMQAFGRCTRNDTDFAAIILVGQEVFDFCAKSENTAGMHPEIRAEVRFGIENSEGKEEPDEFLDLLDVFFEQSDDWEDANEEIIRLRNEIVASGASVNSVLATTCSAEVDFQYAMWSGDYVRALDLAKTVSDQLSGDRLLGYRGWWYYLGGAAAWLASQKQNTSLGKVARDQFERAATCSPSVRWLVELARSLASGEKERPENERTAAAVENAVNVVMDLGLTGQRFEKRIAQLRANLTSTEAAPFERGLEELGRLLGFKTLKPEGNAAPDAIWHLDNNYIIAFEAKSDAKTDHIPVSTARQARGHLDWVKANMKPQPAAKLLAVVVTPQTKLDTDARPFAAGIQYASVQSIQALAKSILSCIREARSEASDRDELSRALATKLFDMDLVPDDVWTEFLKHPLSLLKT